MEHCSCGARNWAHRDTVMGNGPYTLLGQLLLSYGLISEPVLAHALQTHDETGEPLGQLLVSAEAVSTAEFEVVLRAQARLRGKPEPSQPHVLVVDDDPEIGVLIGDILSGAGYSAGVAQNAIEALAALTANDATPPALIVLDLVLPQVGGLALLSQLRDQGCRAPVIVLTGNPSEEARRCAEGLQVREFLVKPVSARALVDVVGKVLRETVSAEA